jgi:uncharacterized protein YyaL (SSP411 family)
MPGFNRVLKTVADAYKNRRGEIEKTAGQIVAVLTLETRGSGKEPLVLDILEQAYLTLQKDFDKENGGFDSAPKFPQLMALEFLLRYFHRTQDKTVLEMVDFTLEKMARGGIYDQLGGGFHRYATDSSWLVPHFEKMLYPSLPAPYLFCYRFIFYG